jgi:hypothetical protein
MTRVGSPHSRPLEAPRVVAPHVVVAHWCCVSFITPLPASLPGGPSASTTGWMGGADADEACLPTSEWPPPVSVSDKSSDSSCRRASCYVTHGADSLY